jgi:hypothetical protein
MDQDAYVKGQETFKKLAQMADGYRRPSLGNLKEIAKSAAEKLLPWKKNVGCRNKDSNIDEVCCNGNVHIAYRGISDDRLYISYSRRWSEVKYFRPQGLKVFCADCRKRIL